MFKRRLMEFTLSTNMWDDTGAVKTSTFVPDFLLKEPTSLILKGDETKALGTTNNAFEEYLWLLLVNSPGTDGESRAVQVYRLVGADCSGAVSNDDALYGRTQPDPFLLAASAVSTVKGKATGCEDSNDTVNALIYDVVFSGVGSTSSAYIHPPSGLVNWWPGDGNASDIQGSSNGTLTNGATFGTGKVGQAFSFDGADDLVALAAQPAISTALTIEGWVNFDSANFDNYQVIFNNNQVLFRKNASTEGNKFSIFVTLTDNSVEPRAQSTTVPTAGTWHHVAGTWDGTTLRIYVNGTPEGSSTRQGTLTSTTATQAQIGRGHLSSLTLFPLDGRIDELSIYNRALTASEIQAIFNAGSAGKIKP